MEGGEREEMLGGGREMRFGVVKGAVARGGEAEARGGEAEVREGYWKGEEKSATTEAGQLFFLRNQCRQR